MQTQCTRTRRTLRKKSSKKSLLVTRGSGRPRRASTKHERKKTYTSWSVPPERFERRLHRDLCGTVRSWCLSCNVTRERAECMYACLRVCVSACPCVCVSFLVSACPSVSDRMFACLHVCICMSVRLCTRRAATQSSAEHSGAQRAHATHARHTRCFVWHHLLARFRALSAALMAAVVAVCRFVDRRPLTTWSSSRRTPQVSWRRLPTLFGEDLSFPPLFLERPADCHCAKWDTLGDLSL